MAKDYKLSVRSHAGELLAGLGAVTSTRASRHLYGTRIWQRTLNGPAPDRLLVNPRNFHPKSPAEAELMLMGRFRLPGGEAVTRDGSPFFVEAPNELWLESLHGFHWLRHFDAGGSEPFQEHLRQLIAHWVRNYGNWNEVAWRPHVIARRLLTWASFGRLILSHADVLFRSRVLLSMARQARHLSKTAHVSKPGLPRMTAAIGLAVSGACLPDGDARLSKGLHLLAEELSIQILQDGGHISRNPESLLEIASDLLSLVDAMVQRDLIIPVTIRRALDRMMPMIRFMRHGDGRLAVFNGASEGIDGWAETILARDTGRNRSVTQASQVGYQRVNCGDTQLIVDAGMAPPPEYSTQAHAGALSFELSSGMDRIIVNCGTSQTKGQEWQDAMRATAAHSTLAVADESSAHVVSSRWARRLLGARLLDGPTRVECKRRESEDGVLLELSHDGYQRRFQLDHERRLFVSHDGSDIRGEDRLQPSAISVVGQKFSIRFHLHPSVRLLRAGSGVVLTLPGGSTWRFSTDTTLVVAESVYLASANQIRKTQQIILNGTTSDRDTSVKWALKRATQGDIEIAPKNDPVN
ncbi:MAG: heparinase II/III family protein [Micropepsaceae bacterium]